VPSYGANSAVSIGGGGNIICIREHVIIIMKCLW